MIEILFRYLKVDIATYDVKVGVSLPSVQGKNSFNYRKGLEGW